MLRRPMPHTTQARPSTLLERLRAEDRLVLVELRPPRTGLSASESIDLWIDMYHSVRRLVRHDTFVFLTDNAVGASEEENLGHIAANLSQDVTPARVVPFLTCKHSLDYCMMYATRAASYGSEALTVVGGDATAGAPRCVAHGYELRRLIRERVPSLDLGGWANPHRDPKQQVDFLLRDAFEAEFYLTQVVSHHDIHSVERFVSEARRRGVPHPGVFGVFYYRSANPKTLSRLASFLPVPAEQITREFEDGLSAEAICARTIRSLWDVGVTKVYVSNLGYRRPDAAYRRLLDALEG